jgi:hypothetical protein
VTDHGDDADDDPQLKSLRAVWLSMPDEEPPERGLAELMAAARVKAEQMAKPSLWQRISALLRRPPVLALATVLVLIGGAVFIGQRRDKLASEPTATGSMPLFEDDRGANRARDTSVATGSAAVVEAPAAAPSAAQEQTAAKTDPAFVPVEPPKEEPPSRPSRPSRRPAGPSITVEPQDQKKSEVGHSKLESNGIARGEGGRVDEKPKISGGDSFAAPEKTTTTSTMDLEKDEPKAGVAAQPSTDRAPTSAPPPPSSPPSRAAQYLAQARSAAARGDCTAARTMMKRLANADAATYKKALATDASLKKCVVTAAE